jgi:hypothetical protein
LKTGTKQVNNRLMSDDKQAGSDLNPSPLRLDISRLESFEIAAELDMLMAYPDASPKRRAALRRARCAEQIRVTIEAHPDLRDGLFERYPDYIPNNNRTSYLHFDKRHQEAQAFGVTILPFIKLPATGLEPIFQGKPYRPTMNLHERFLYPIADMAKTRDAYDGLHEIKARKHRPRYPIAHLCAAYQLIARIKEDQKLSPQYDGQDLNFWRDLISVACWIAEILRATPELTHIAVKLIDIQWIEPPQVSAPSRIP